MGLSQDIQSMLKKLYKPNPQHLTKAQINSLRSAFNTIDTDHDQKITLDETKTFFREVGINPIFAPLAFELCDTDKNNVITFDEFAPFFKCLDDLDQDPRCIYRNLFEKFDDNTNGYLEKAELVKLLSYFESEPWSESEAEAIINSHDVDNDGRLNFEELCQMIEDEF